ncbi:tetratricopeptide repeat protein [Sphingomicrobium nitratireducens]|uniref:tetratricopeptide repeat protein n=1 Tax=Sphingomicrobium nitratireducens TaxID=2964666 RepID=UPI00223EA00C|nr:hypothetical protein [Sphingomicrobium nitratireducens]
MITTLLLSLALQDADVAGPPRIEAPAELFSCGTDVSARSALCRAATAEGQGRYADAAEGFAEAATLSVDDTLDRVVAEIAAANMWLAAGEPGKADAALARAIAEEAVLDPVQQGLARIDRARAALALGEPDRARILLAEAETLVDEDPFLFWMKGTLALDAGDVAEARADVDKGLMLAADSPELLYLAGHVALAEGDAARARSEWSVAAKFLGNPSGKAAADALAELDAPQQGAGN